MNSVNKTLVREEGIDGAIYEAAGTVLIDECRRLNSYETGEYKIRSL